MANFIVYKYKFKEKTTSDLFMQGDVRVNETFLNTQFENTLTGIAKNTGVLNLFDIKADKSGTSEPELYINEIKGCAMGVTWLEVRNRKQKKYTPQNSHEKSTIDDFPFCWVIIDTRPSSQLILVERKNETFTNTDFVADLIVNWFSREQNLSEIGWQLGWKQRMCAGDIWDIIHTRTANGEDSVRNVTLYFDGKRNNPINEVDKALRFVLNQLASPNGELKLYSSDSIHRIWEETERDVRETVTMLLSNHYHLKVGFKISGTVEYGKNTIAVYGCDDSYIKLFGNKIVFDKNCAQSYDLIIWLDKYIVSDDSKHRYIDGLNKKSRKRRKNDRRKSA